MARSIAVAALQLAAHDRGDFRVGLERALDAARLASRKADLIVLPEATFPAYVLGKTPLGAHETQDAIEGLRVIARETRTVIVAGAAVLRDGRAHNAAVVIDADGSLAGHADKLFLWHFDRQWFEGGQRLAPVQTKIGRSRRADLRRRPASDDFSRVSGSRRGGARYADGLGNERPQPAGSGERASGSLGSRPRLRKPRAVHRRQQVRQRARHGRVLRQEPDRRQRRRDRRVCERA